MHGYPKEKEKHIGAGMDSRGNFNEIGNQEDK